MRDRISNVKNKAWITVKVLFARPALVTKVPVATFPRIRKELPSLNSDLGHLTELANGLRVRAWHLAIRT
jgi:hypothetical protein